MPLQRHSCSEAFCNMHRDILSDRATVLGFPWLYQRANIETRCVDKNA
jgi:hypothetical protein